MLSIALLNQAGETLKTVELNEEVFGIEPNQQVIYDVVNAQRAAMRQGTHDTLNRTEVVVRSLGAKREQDALVKDQFVLLNGVVEVLYLDLLLEAML